MKPVKKPCIRCVYFKVCGSTTRTMPCDGRKTKREQQKEKCKKHIKYVFTVIKEMEDEIYG